MSECVFLQRKCKNVYEIANVYHILCWTREDRSGQNKDGPCCHPGDQSDNRQMSKYGR